MQDLQEIQAHINLHFADSSLLERALMHRSYLNENPNTVSEDNERLEFLGDAVLDFVVGAYLYQRFPELREGELTMLRAALVRTKTLASFAKATGIGEMLRLGIGEAESGGRNRPAILCAAFEAIVGAIYLDQGLEKVTSWVEPFITPALERIIASSAHKDAKSEFQIWAQAEFNETPRYEVISAEGPDHQKVFTVTVLVAGKSWGIGRGNSKQAAAQQAASQALEKAETLDLAPALERQPTTEANEWPDS